jgi:transcriptional regulator with XRE-family HTH domain
MPRRTELDPMLVQIGSTIRRLRREKCLSLDALSERTGMNKGHLSSIEAGKVSVTFLLAIRIARALDVSVADLAPSAPQSEASAKPGEPEVNHDRLPEEKGSGKGRGGGHRAA